MRLKESIKYKVNVMSKIFGLKEYFQGAGKESGSDSWYKLLPTAKKKSFISDCLSEFVVQTSEKKVVYFNDINRLFHRETGVKPSGNYVSEVFREKFGTQSITVQCSAVHDTLGELHWYAERRSAYFGFVLKSEIDFNRLQEIKKRYEVTKGVKGLEEYFDEARKGIASDSWYKLLWAKQKKSFILDCLSEFVVQTSEEKSVYFHQIMGLFYSKIGVKPSATYISEILEDKFGAQSVKDVTDKKVYLGVMLKCEIDLDRLYEIRKKYTTLGYKNRI